MQTVRCSACGRRAVRLDLCDAPLIAGSAPGGRRRSVTGVDFHNMLPPAATAYFCRRADDLHRFFLKELVSYEGPAAYQGLRQMTQIPLAIGEEFSSKWYCASYVEQDITNYARADLYRAGGLTEAKRIAATSEAHCIDVLPHNPGGLSARRRPSTSTPQSQMCL